MLVFELLTFLQTPLHTEIQARTQSSAAQDWQVHIQKPIRLLLECADGFL